MEIDYWDKISKAPQQQKPRVPVEVTLKVKTDGKMLPMYIKWQNGCIYEIDKILDIKPRGMHKVIYKVMINGKTTLLYFDEQKWLVDAK